MSLSPDVRAQYIKIIDSILASSDLNKISEKRIRNGLQDAVQYDITPQKAAIKVLIMERFDKFVQKDGDAVESTSNGADVPVTNGHAHTTKSSDSTPNPQSLPSPPTGRKSYEADDIGEATTPRSPKKRKIDVAESDAAFAARLQAEENARARATRGGGSRKNTPVKKRSVKSKNKIKAEEDSDVGSGSETVRKVNRNTGFHKPLNLSPALSALLDGEVALSRPETVKRIWVYIKARDLQDPNDKRQIRCDDAMKAVFKSEKVHMFTMNKILNQNLYPQDE